MSHSVLLVVLQWRCRCGTGSSHRLGEGSRCVRALLACGMAEVSKRQDMSGIDEMGRMSREARAKAEREDLEKSGYLPGKAAAGEK